MTEEKALNIFRLKAFSHQFAHDVQNTNFNDLSKWDMEKMNLCLQIIMQILGEMQIEEDRRRKPIKPYPIMTDGVRFE